MTDAEEIEDGLTETEANRDQRFYFVEDNDWYACSASGFSNAKKLDFGGFESNIAGSITVRQSVFPGRKPLPNDDIRYKTVTYRVHKILSAPGDVFYRFDCVFPDSGV